eukprot:m.243306 g.243306  ORF g.243306 m.243306 type:complete len:585 (+) comp14211_c0_seq1:40-1794(+)
MLRTQMLHLSPSRDAARAVNVEEYLEHVDLLGPRHLCSLGAALISAQRASDAEAVLAKAVNAYTGTRDSRDPWYGDALLNYGIALGQLRQFEPALRAYDQASREYYEIRDWEGYSIATANFATLCPDPNEAYERLASVHNELSMASTDIDPGLLIRVQVLSATIAFNTGKVINAITHLREAIEACTDNATLAILNQNIGSFYNHEGDFELASAYHTTAQGIYEAMGTRGHLAEVYDNQGYAEACRARYEEALGMFQKAEKEWRFHSRHDAEIRSLQRLAAVQVMLKDYSASIQSLQQAKNAAARFHPDEEPQVTERLDELWALLQRKSNSRPTTPKPPPPPYEPPPIPETAVPHAGMRSRRQSQVLDGDYDRASMPLPADVLQATGMSAHPVTSTPVRRRSVSQSEQDGHHGHHGHHSHHPHDAAGIEGRVEYAAPNGHVEAGHGAPNGTVANGYGEADGHDVTGYTSDGEITAATERQNITARADVTDFGQESVVHELPQTASIGTPLAGGFQPTRASYSRGRPSLVPAPAPSGTISASAGAPSTTAQLQADSLYIRTGSIKSTKAIRGSSPENNKSKSCIVM